MNKTKKVISLFMICFLITTLAPVAVLGVTGPVADIKWTFQEGTSPGDGYVTNYVIECSTDYAYNNNMATHAPGGSYQSPSGIWAVYDVPVQVAGTYKLYMYFGSSAMNSTDMDFKSADFTATVGGTWDGATDTYTGGTVAFSNSGIVGGGWGTLGNQYERCKEVPIGYITLAEGTNTIKLDITPTFHFRIASKSFRLEYIEPAEYENCMADGSELDLSNVPAGIDNITVNYTNDVYTDNIVYSLKQGETPIAIDLKPSADKKKVTFGLRESLVSGNDYTLSVSGLESEIGSVTAITETITAVTSGSGNSVSPVEITSADMTGTTITVSGVVKNSLGDTLKGREVKLHIKGPGEGAFTDVSVSDISDVNGVVDMCYTIPSPAASGPYQVKIVEQYGTEDIETTYYVDADLAENIFSDIKNAADGAAVKTILTNNNDVLGLDLNAIATEFTTNENLFYARFAGKNFDSIPSFGSAWEENFVLEKLNQEINDTNVKTLLIDEQTRTTLGIDSNNYHESLTTQEDAFWAEITALPSQADIQTFRKNYNNISAKHLLLSKSYTIPVLNSLSLSGYSGQLLEDNVSLVSEAADVDSYEVQFTCSDENDAAALSMNGPKRETVTKIVSGKTVSFKTENLENVNYQNLGKMSYSTTGPETLTIKMSAIVNYNVSGFSEVVSYSTDEANVSISVTDNTQDSEPSYSSDYGSVSRPGVSVSTPSVSAPSVSENKGSASDNVDTKPVSAEQAFEDLDSVLWAYDSIDALYKQGIITISENKQFRPNDSVTRAEFIKMLVVALGIVNQDVTADFSDVSKDAWYYTYVASAVQNGLITGDENGRFNPGGNISRQDICVILSRVMDKVGHPSETYNEIFTDSDEISAYAKDAVYRLYNVNVISGMGDGTFAPKNDATRAQTAKMLMNFLEGVGV